MLYEIGVMLILLSAAFCGGSVLVPVVIASVGALIMFVGRRKRYGNDTDTER